MSRRKHKLELDFETADRITLLNLKDHRSYLQKELRDHKKGEWLHPEDVVKNQQLIEALNTLVKYYGG